MLKKTVLAAVAMLALNTTSAHAVTKGQSMFAIQLGSGTADLYDPRPTPPIDYISAYEHSELNVRGQFWRMMSDDYAVAISAGLGFFAEEDEPGPGATPGSPTLKYSQSSFHVRIGGDRVASVGSRAIIYFGPGIEYWSGKAKFEGFVPSAESESITRISLAGRMGGMMMLGPNWGLTGDIGHKIGRASAEDGGAKMTLWPSSFEGHAGILFMFGGN